jgi:hypothetical protein
MESPPSSIDQDESLSSKWSNSLPTMTTAALVRRSRTLQQGYIPSPIAVHMCTPTPPRQSRALSTPMLLYCTWMKMKEYESHAGTAKQACTPIPGSHARTHRHLNGALTTDM